MEHFTVISVTEQGQQLNASGFTSQYEVRRHISERVSMGAHLGYRHAHFIVIRSAHIGLTPVTVVKMYDHSGQHVHPDEVSSVNISLGRDPF